MSGPKSYSAEVVDRHLKVFFRYLSEVETLWDILTKRSIFDKKRNIAISGDEIIQPLKSLLDEISGPTFNQSGEILSQAEFDAFYNQIISITDKQKQLIAALETHIEDFDQLEEFYQVYVELDALANRYAKDFDDLKTQLIQHLQKTLTAGSASELIIENVRQSAFAYQLPTFTAENAKETEKERVKMMKAYEASRSAIIKISKGIAVKKLSAATINKVQLTSANSSAPKTGLTLHQKEVMEKIEAELASIAGQSIEKEFARKLGNLQNVKNDKLNFLLGELLDDIKNHKQQKHYRQLLQKIDIKLKDNIYDPALKKDVAQLKSIVIKTLEKDMIKTGEMLKVKEFEVAFNQKVSEHKSKIHQKTAEQNFVKARLIAALQEMEFEVVADAEVIDLEQTGSYLLQIPNQANFLNLRFDDSGRVLYNFLIPENKDDLSIDEKNLKLAEMEEACTEFKKTLSDLHRQGLKIDLSKEMEISEKALISVPAALRSTISNEQQPGHNRRKLKNAKNRMRFKE